MWIVRVRDIVEEDHWIVFGSVLAATNKGTNAAAYVFLIRLPRNVGSVQQGNQVELCGLVVDSRVVVVRDTKIGSCLQPQIVWFAWVIAWRIVVLLGMGR